MPHYELAEGDHAERIKRKGRDVLLKGTTLGGMRFEQQARMLGGYVATTATAEVLVAPDFDRSLRMDYPTFERTLGARLERRTMEVMGVEYTPSYLLREAG